MKTMSEFWNVVAFHPAVGQLVMVAPVSDNEEDARAKADEAKRKGYYRYVTIFNPGGDAELA